MNIPLGEWNGANATKALQAAIERLHKENAKQQRWMLALTAIAAIAAIIAAVPVILAWLT